MSIPDPSNDKPLTLVKATQVSFAILMLGFLSFVGIVMGSFYWSVYVNATSAKNWNGCAAPRNEAEHQEWSASAKATGETLCEPGFIEDEKLF